MTRIWECDKCSKQVKGIYKPEGWYDVKFFIKAQSKGSKSFGCNLCRNCAMKLFKVVRIELKKAKE